VQRLTSSRLAGSLTICACAAGLIMASAPAAGASTTVRPAIAQGSTWSGYADTDSGGHTYSEVSGTWAEPSAKCTSTTSEAAFWVGLDGLTSDTVEQVGTLAACEDGTASYYTWWEMYPSTSVQVVGTTVKPGDKITASVTKTGTKYALKLTDATTSGNNVTETETCAACLGTSAEWVAENPGGAVTSPLNVGTWTVSGATVKSGTVTGVISTFPHESFGSGTGPLNKNGNGFTVTWPAPL
jgi:Peptidase A4 family